MFRDFIKAAVKLKENKISAGDNQQAASIHA
ncbi:uncharacterized protein METZ01_LOCUS399771 [marine metagenome]|uniref:Uncharacterized protein n=1 Tax=marine metagenome TaxID=408172 RepID=A0A382VK76_9ZZZZ